MPTSTELWNNTPKKTLRYRVEKRVHGSEEKNWNLKNKQGAVPKCVCATQSRIVD